MTCYYKPKYGGGCRHAGLGHWDTELRVYYDEGLAYPQTVTYWVDEEEPCDGENADCPDYIEADCPDYIERELLKAEQEHQEQVDRENKAREEKQEEFDE